MEEPQRRSMLYFIEGNRVSEICRLVYCAAIQDSSDAVLKSFGLAAKEYSSEVVTGLLLVYPEYIVHLIEAPEEEIFQICRHFFVRCSRFVKNTKCFPVQVEVVARFFDKWYARKSSHYNLVHENIKTDSAKSLLSEDSFENISAIYRKTIHNLYKFYRELRQLSNRNHVIAQVLFVVVIADPNIMTNREYAHSLQTLMVELLESLNEDGHRLLAERSTMEFILTSRWGQSLEGLTDRFLNPISIDPNTAWPFPKVTLPKVDFNKIEKMKDELKIKSNIESGVLKEK